MRLMRRRLRRSGFYRSFFNFFVGVFGLWGCFACPTLTGLIDPSGSRRGNQGRCFGRLLSVLVFFRLMLFCCFSVGLKKYELLLCPRNLAANRGSIPADFGASVFFLTPSLLYRKGAGHRRFIPRKIMPPVCSSSIRIPSAISSLGCHASLVSRPRFCGGFGVIL